MPKMMEMTQGGPAKLLLFTHSIWHNPTCSANLLEDTEMRWGLNCWMDSKTLYRRKSKASSINSYTGWKKSSTTATWYGRNPRNNGINMDKPSINWCLVQDFTTIHHINSYHCPLLFHPGFNVNPGLINPGWWIVVVLSNNSSWLLKWYPPNKQPRVYQSRVDITSYYIWSAHLLNPKDGRQSNDPPAVPVARDVVRHIDGRGNPGISTAWYRVFVGISLGFKVIQWDLWWFNGIYGDSMGFNGDL